MGHLGLTPQSIYKFGTYTVRAKEEEEADKLVEDAKLLERLGCFVLKKIPAHLAEKVAKSISIPVGIGAGGVDGQVLVIHDMLGMNNEFSRFLRRYESIRRNDDCYWSICCRCKIE
jgi:3-methyl-2-oxobutanoate hydroxymethyltransferase